MAVSVMLTALLRRLSAPSLLVVVLNVRRMMTALMPPNQSVIRARIFVLIVLPVSHQQLFVTQSQGSALNVLGMLTALILPNLTVTQLIMFANQVNLAMFDAEQMSVCLNALYEANVTDDMLALIYEANRTTIFAVKTPNGITRSAQIVNKVLQGDVLAPLI